MKAVIWTDVFQSIVMVTGLLAIIIQVSTMFLLLTKNNVFKSMFLLLN